MLVGHNARVGRPPTVNMDSRNGRGVVYIRFSDTHRATSGFLMFDRQAITSSSRSSDLRSHWLKSAAS
jgi:hypothetical protein